MAASSHLVLAAAGSLVWSRDGTDQSPVGAHVRSSGLTVSCSGLAGRSWALGGADQRPAPRAPGRNQRPAPPSAPRLAWASRSPGHPPELFCPGLIPGLGWHARESRSGAARHARAVSCACARCRARSAHMSAALAHIRAPRRHAMRYATTCSGIMNDAVLVCIRKCAYRQVDTDQQELQNGVNQQHRKQKHFSKRSLQ